MSALQKVHHGKVFTHLIELLGELEAALRAGNVPLQKVTERLEYDPVYIAIAAETFVSPVEQSPNHSTLRARLGSLRQLLADSQGRLAPLETFLKTIEKFLASGKSDWHRKHGFFIVPVIDTNGQAGMVYLYSPRKQWMPNVARKRLDTEDLTQDDRLVTHFDMLAAVMLKRFFYVRYYPLDRYTGLSDFSYRLHFDCQITQGMSVDAAILATYLLNYLQSALGEEAYAEYVAPQVGTLLTGVIDTQGRIHPVEHLEQKVLCAVREYGQELKIIIPEGEMLTKKAMKEIDPNNLFYVRSVEELMSTVLAKHGDPRGLGKAREGIFRNLLPQEIADLASHRLPDVPEDIYVRKPKWREPVSYPLGLHSLASAWNDRLDIAFGPNPFSLISEDTPFAYGKKLIQVILDGSAAMDGHWVTEPPSEVSRMSIALYEIARRIDPEREDLVFGFLSSRHFEPYDHRRYTSARVLEPLLQNWRQRLGLHNRGSFMRPVRQQSIALYSARQKRIYLLSEVVIPDLQDIDEERVESLELLCLTPQKAAANRPEARRGGLPMARHAIFSEALSTDQELLSRYFHKQAMTLPEIEVDIGTDLPVLWEPAAATISRRDARYVLRHRYDEALEWRLRLRLANRYPHRVTVTGTLNRDGQLVEYSFQASPTVTVLPPLRAWQEGELTGEEFELWKIISSPDGVCPYPQCQSPRSVHLFHDSSRIIMLKPIFSSLASLSDGWLLMIAAEPRWLFFTTGCQIAGLSIAIVDRQPHYSAAESHLEAFTAAPQERELYALQHGGHTFYLSRILGSDS